MMAGVHAANSSAPPPPPPSSSHGGAGIPVETLKQVDISYLSQSELQALSLCSVSSYNVRRTDDVVSPHLDRSVFNESAGSRRQTYSRLHHRSHSRLPGLHPSFKPHRQPHFSSDHVSHSIVHFLKHFLSGNRDPPPPPPAPPSPPPPEEPKPMVTPTVDLGFLGLQEKLKVKRKGVRKSKNSSQDKIVENGDGMELQQVNSKAEVVDLQELEKNGDELYTEELKKRTMGLETEDGVLGFLWSLEGQWCSRRKKRKYVDAAIFGDALPIGWKLLLGLRRRDFRVSVYCRRYISPSGQQFLSCKEAASFLKSHFGASAADQKTYSVQQTHNIPSEKGSSLADKADDAAHDELGRSTLGESSRNSHDNCLEGIENLPEVQVQDNYECVKCNLRFDDKDAYLQHLFTFHQKTTKRHKFGAPVGEGVIIKDGKYECQFCHKVFLERRSYNGHVGIHVRNSGKNSNEPTAPNNLEKKPPEPPLPEEIPSRSSKMDALIEIAHNSIVETSAVDTGEKAITSNEPSVLSIEAQAAPTANEAHFLADPVEIQKEDSSAVSAHLEVLNHDTEVMTVDNDVVRNDDYAWSVNVKMDTDCVNDSNPSGAGEIENCESSLGMGYDNRCLKPSDDHPEDTTGIAVAEDVFHGGVSPVPLDQSLQFFPPFESASNKGESEFSVAAQKIESVTGFEELRFDDIGPFQYDFVNEQELPSLPGGPMNLRADSVMDDGFNSTVAFGSDDAMLNENQITVCVWCRTEFKLEGIDSETPSDSIGYMCPNCKTKISGHFSDALSMDPRNL
ncbi:uncharacterized protein LOC127254498 [Andrographis paniculata]|uniref:uncharacterized protein LOC127254498 n=1 Tax=Andrographis paniculata TaxID=175694 RepID=UPI0021E74AD5|nr:uncharacterized protein LOC127254498 [Andrographis paniculata]